MPILMRESGFFLADYWRFLNEANEDNEDWVPYSTPEAVQVFVFSDPFYDAERRWVEIIEDKLAADLTVKIQRTRLPEALIELHIAKFGRRKGLGEALLSTALESLTEHSGSIRVILTPGNREVLSFAKAQGFEGEKMVDLERGLDALEKPQVPEGYRIASLGMAQLRGLARLWNEIFGASRGLEEMEAMMAWGDILTEIAVTFSAFEAVGFSLAQVVPRANHDEGSVAQIGISEKHRRKGIGKALLLTSLLWLRRQGCPTAMISAMADNFPALELYRKVGFKVLRVREKHLIRRGYPLR